MDERTNGRMDGWRSRVNNDWNARKLFAQSWKYSQHYDGKCYRRKKHGNAEYSQRERQENAGLSVRNGKGWCLGSYNSIRPCSCTSASHANNLLLHAAYLQIYTAVIHWATSTGRSNDPFCAKNPIKANGAMSQYVLDQYDWQRRLINSAYTMHCNSGCKSW